MGAFHEQEHSRGHGSQKNGEDLYHKSSPERQKVSIISFAQRHVGWIVASPVVPSQSLGFTYAPKARLQWLDSCLRLGIH